MRRTQSKPGTDINRTHAQRVRNRFRIGIVIAWICFAAFLITARWITFMICGWPWEQFYHSSDGCPVWLFLNMIPMSMLGIVFCGYPGYVRGYETTRDDFRARYEFLFAPLFICCLILVPCVLFLMEKAFFITLGVGVLFALLMEWYVKVTFIQPQTPLKRKRYIDWKDIQYGFRTFVEENRKNSTLTLIFTILGIGIWLFATIASMLGLF